MGLFLRHLNHHVTGDSLMTQTNQKPQSTKNNPEQQTSSRTYSRGGLFFRLFYSRWRQVLAFFDLLGTDGRPSSTKMMSFGISITVLFTAIHQTIHHHDGEIWNWPMFWILFLCCAVMFGRWGFDRFITVMKEKQTLS